jgi:2-dehydro-3-deoxy-D-arabinonate dehydratase
MPIRLFRTTSGVVIEQDGRYHLAPAADWDALLNADDIGAAVSGAVAGAEIVNADAVTDTRLLPPVGLQEVWAAGVTYYRSRTARMEESRVAGGGSFYDRVYAAERPELFFKATPHRVVGPGGRVRIRADSRWSVPEPELALVVNRRGAIVGCTIGNDMSARDIEGENPLYLPQAKVYAACCALGPAVLVGRGALSPETAIQLEIRRDGTQVFAGSTDVAMLKRTADELVGFLYRDNDFPQGCVLLTGTGIVPPDEFTLQQGDEIAIAIPPIGTLRTVVQLGGTAAV